MSRECKREGNPDTLGAVEKKLKFGEREGKFTKSIMSIQCSECGNNVADSKQGISLLFFEDGNAAHLILRLADLGKKGACFSSEDVPPEKKPTDKNPYASVSHILCANTRNGKTCKKKVGAVKCMPPHSDNKLIFFSYKNLTVDGVRYKNWKHARENSILGELQVMPPSDNDIKRKFVSRKWPCLAKSLEAAKKKGTMSHDASDSLDGRGLTKTKPRPYQSELFRMVTRTERNSLVYLPTGLGKTLVAAMVVKCMSEWNPERLAVFLVETNALAIQQAEKVRDETKLDVELMIGSTLAMKREGTSGLERLNDVRRANVIVATAGAFEHAMCKDFIDPESIYCVILDEAHHCGKEHPFNRVTRNFLVQWDASHFSAEAFFSSSAGAQKPIRTFPKVIAMTASPAGELSVEGTVMKLEELLGRLGATFAAPVETIEDVKSRSPRVELELAHVRVTTAERDLLRCLEILVLGRITKLVHPDSDVGVQAQALLVHARKSAKTDSRLAPQDENWRFPNKAHVVLLQQAIHTRNTTKVTQSAESKGHMRTSGSGEICNGFSSLDYGAGTEGPAFSSVSDGGLEDLRELINLAFAVDELGGDATWWWVLKALKKEEEEEDDGNDFSSSDPDREEAIKILESVLHVCALSNDSDAETEDLEQTDLSKQQASMQPAGGYFGNAEGSKLKMIASMLQQHRERCDQESTHFSALIFVSTRKLAMATPGMLQAMPGLEDIVLADSIVGLSEMTLAQQRTSLSQFRDGHLNVLVSTSVCGEGIDVPTCGLVICTALPNSGTALVQLRGRIRCGVNCRFVGLSRTCGTLDQEHVRTICTRETNMLAAIRHLSRKKDSKHKDSSSKNSLRESTAEMVAESESERLTLNGNHRQVLDSSSSTAPPSSESDGSPVSQESRMQKSPPGMDAFQGNPWKREVTPLLSSSARRYAMAFLGTTTRQTLQKSGNTKQMARCILNSAVQLAPILKPKVEYEDRRGAGPAHTPCFECRCFVSSQIEELEGLILVKEGKGSSIKAAREAAATKVVKVLESQPSASSQHERFSSGR